MPPPAASFCATGRNRFIGGRLYSLRPRFLVGDGTDGAAWDAVRRRADGRRPGELRAARGVERSVSPGQRCDPGRLTRSPTATNIRPHENEPELVRVRGDLGGRRGG